MKVITVASAKGGVGKSTFCCLMGKILASRKKKILLIDMDIGVRSLDIMLNIAENVVYNWGDIVSGNCEYKKAIAEVRNNLYLLPAPMDFSNNYTIERFGVMLNELKEDFDYIFLDSPAGVEFGFRLAVSAADECIIISTPEATSIRAASFAADRARDYTNGNIRLLINKFNRNLHKNIDIDEIIDTIGARLLGIIPQSNEIYISNLGGKIPTDSRGGQALLRVSKRIEDISVPLRVKYL